MYTQLFSFGIRSYYRRAKIARDFRVFFLGHKGAIEARYTTNKNILPKSLVDEMREAFKRCEEFLDLDMKQEDPLLRQREVAKDALSKATPEQMQVMLKILSVGNTQVRE